MSNVGKLNSIVTTPQYKPEDLANGASDLIEEVQNTKITGEEEAFSHIDLVDFSGMSKALNRLTPRYGRDWRRSTAIWSTRSINSFKPY